MTYETVQAVFTVQKCHTVTGMLNLFDLSRALFNCSIGLCVEVFIFFFSLQNVFATPFTRLKKATRMTSSASRSAIPPAPTLTRPYTTKPAAQPQSSIATILAADMELLRVPLLVMELREVLSLDMEHLNQITASARTAPSATTRPGNLRFHLLFLFFF